MSKAKKKAAPAKKKPAAAPKKKAPRKLEQKPLIVDPDPEDLPDIPPIHIPPAERDPTEFENSNDELPEYEPSEEVIKEIMIQKGVDRERAIYILRNPE